VVILAVPSQTPIWLESRFRVASAAERITGLTIDWTDAQFPECGIFFSDVVSLGFTVLDQPIKTHATDWLSLRK
jgi:hypothetical protein